MTEKQYDKFRNTIDKEIEEYKREVCNNAPIHVYERFYEIHAYEEIYDFLCHDAINHDIKGFPAKNILDHFYCQFMKTDYDLTQEDLYDFLEEETKLYKSQSEL